MRTRSLRSGAEVCGKMCFIIMNWRVALQVGGVWMRSVRHSGRKGWWPRQQRQQLILLGIPRRIVVGNKLTGAWSHSKNVINKRRLGVAGARVLRSRWEMVSNWH
jgi:hypothetical protein